MGGLAEQPTNGKSLVEAWREYGSVAQMARAVVSRVRVPAGPQRGVDFTIFKRARQRQYKWGQTGNWFPQTKCRAEVYGAAKPQNESQRYDTFLIGTHETLSGEKSAAAGKDRQYGAVAKMECSGPPA